MSKVFRQEDVVNGCRKIVEEAVRDLSPGIWEAAVEMFEPWVGGKSEERSGKLLGGGGETIHKEDQWEILW
ncbi:MAG: hypothetical protein ACFE8Z_11420 [Candidatus Hermodarchaeota archaeon]